MPQLTSPAPHAMEMSLFDSATRPVPRETITAARLVELVRRPSPALVRSLSEARAALAAGDAGKYSALKRGLPAASFAGVFQQRRIDGLVAHSGLMPIDIDHLDAAALASAREKLRGDPHCVFLYVSPSGAGLKGAIRLGSIPAGDPGHKRAFAAVSRYLSETHGLALDAACKDVSRLAFLSGDPACHYHPDAAGLDVEIWAPAPEGAAVPAGNAASTDLLAAPSGPRSDSLAGGTGDEGDFVLYCDNDAGRAARFVDRWRDEIRYVADRGVWLVWEGRWKVDNAGGITRRAIILATEIYNEIVAQPVSGKEDMTRRAEDIKKAAKWGNKPVIDAMLSLAETHSSIQCLARDLDADPWLLGTPNAIVDLRTGEGVEHTPDHLVTMSTRAVFDPEARAPRWERFIEEIYPDPALRRYVWKALGYAITGHTDEKCFHFLLGAGNNGKSKECEAIEHVVGEYAGHAAKGLLCANDKGSYPLREAASIVGKRIIIGPETETRERLNIAVLKALTGHGDIMRAAHLYENQFDFVPVGKLFIMGNHKPTISDTGAAIWNRVRLIPHERIFTAEEQDKKLGTKLREEASGILNWLIEGALLWQQEGLEPPEKVRAAVEQYRAEEDSLGEFLGECIEEKPGNVVPHSAIFASYAQWADVGGVRFPLTKRGLAKCLRENGWKQVATTETRTAWEGVILL